MPMLTANNHLEAAGYTDQAASDLDAIYGPPEVGIVANNHPGTRKRMAGRSLSQMQANRHPKPTHPRNRDN